jgi:hypothetical protein
VIWRARGHEHGPQLHRDVIGGYYPVNGAGSASMVDHIEERRA